MAREKQKEYKFNDYPIGIFRIVEDDGDYYYLAYLGIKSRQVGISQVNHPNLMSCKVL